MNIHRIIYLTTRWMNPFRTFRYFKSCVRSLIIWFPVIWNDREWDQHYLYVILHKKLQLMEKYHQEHGISADADKVAKDLRICVHVLDRLIKDDYYRAPPEQIKNMKEHSNFMDFLNREMTERQTKDILEASKDEEYRIDQDIELLFTMMRKKIRGWWD